MNRSLLFSIAFLVPLLSVGQGTQRMPSNRFTHIGMAVSPTYVSAHLTYELFENTWISAEAYTDGGGIWKENVYNDWRSLSILGSIPMLKDKSNRLFLGAGVVQTSESLRGTTLESFGLAPQIRYVSTIADWVSISGHAVYPISPAPHMVPSVGIGVSVTLGRYAKENGLFQRKGRPTF